MYFVVEFRNKCCHFSSSLHGITGAFLSQSPGTEWRLAQEMQTLTLGTKWLKYPVFSIH